MTLWSRHPTIYLLSSISPRFSSNSWFTAFSWKVWAQASRYHIWYIEIILLISVTGAYARSSTDSSAFSKSSSISSDVTLKPHSRASFAWKCPLAIGFFKKPGRFGRLKVSYSVYGKVALKWSLTLLTGLKALGNRQQRYRKYAYFLDTPCRGLTPHIAHGSTVLLLKRICEIPLSRLRQNCRGLLPNTCQFAQACWKLPLVSSATLFWFQAFPLPLSLLDCVNSLRYFCKTRMQAS